MRVLITGGTFDDICNLDGLIYDTAVVFDPATSSYSPEKKMREPRYGHSATLLLDGKVLVVGSTAELFDPATSSFVITGDPNVARPDRRATRLADGRVLQTPLVIRLHKNLPAMSYLGNNDRYGEVVIATGHPDAPELAIRLKFAVQE